MTETIILKEWVVTYWVQMLDTGPLCGGGVLVFRVEVIGSLCDDFAEGWHHEVFGEGKVGAADLQGFLDEVDPFVFVGEISFLWVETAVVFGEEVPTKHEVVDEILDDSAIHPHESAIDAEADVDDAE